MTAASGLVHEEFHGRDYAGRGGLFEMVQLWVNLPAKDKLAPPRYQGILSSQNPTVALPEGRGSVRVIAGAYAGTAGLAQTFTPVQVWDLRLGGAAATDFPVPDGFTTMLARPRIEYAAWVRAAVTDERRRLWQFYQAALHAYAGDREAWAREMKQVMSEDGSNPYYRWLVGDRGGAT